MHLFLSFVKSLLSFHYKRSIQNKPVSTVNKHRDTYSCLFKVVFMSKKSASCYDGVLSAWFHFKRRCELRLVVIVMRDDLAVDSSLLVVKKIKIISKCFRKNIVRSCWKIFVAKYGTLKNALFLWAERQRAFWNVLFFLARSAMQRFYSLARILCSVDDPCYYGFYQYETFTAFLY